MTSTDNNLHFICGSVLFVIHYFKTYDTSELLLTGYDSQTKPRLDKPVLLGVPSGPFLTPRIKMHVNAR